MNKSDEILEQLWIIKIIAASIFILLFVLVLYVSVRLGGPLFP